MRLVSEKELSFEAAFARLEEILEKMNSGSVPLDESLKLYEEADKLIISCQKRLNDAERKIEILIKNRNGETALSTDNKPITQEFQPGQGK
ncbi:MAG: exodeoxyribonuclease VII small subunit [Parachlamydiaceae bacterium]|nr:MAG: exodeoxyribonuclease VII small subunit [Parachlamydiaceae bacterium]